MNRPTRQLPEVQFHNPRLSKLGVEVIGLESLKRKLGEGGAASPQRVDFLLLLFVESGSGVHVVDFVRHTLKAGDVLLVRPGQVQEWLLTARLRGLLLLVSPTALGPTGGVSDGVSKLLAFDLLPTVFRPNEHLFRHAVADLRRLGDELETFNASEGAIAIARHALVTLLLRLSHENRANQGILEEGSTPTLYRLFSRQLDALYKQRLAVVDHARRLGYSESSLSRACVDAVGLTAKEIIDRRVALEAKRMLAHSQVPAAHIGHQLGFSEPTNFVKFFRRMCGETPLSFRRRFSPDR